MGEAEAGGTTVCREAVGFLILLSLSAETQADNEPCG